MFVKGHTVTATVRRPSKPSAVEHRIRARDGATVRLRYNRAKAIKLCCMECMGWDDPEGCTSPLCPLYPFRGRTMASQRGDGQGEASKAMGAARSEV